MTSEWITPSEAAGLLCVHPETLRRRSAEAKLTVERTDGGHRRYRRDEIEQLRETVAAGSWALPVDTEREPSLGLFLEQKIQPAWDRATQSLHDAGQKHPPYQPPRLVRELLTGLRSLACYWFAYLACSYLGWKFAGWWAADTFAGKLLQTKYATVQATQQAVYDASVQLYLTPLWWLCIIVTAMCALRAIVQILNAMLRARHAQQLRNSTQRSSAHAPPAQLHRSASDR